MQLYPIGIYNYIITYIFLFLNPKLTIFLFFRFLCLRVADDVLSAVELPFQDTITKMPPVKISMQVAFPHLWRVRI